jgi:hypothetical protein
LTAHISNSANINNIEARSVDPFTNRHVLIAFAALFALNLLLRVFYLRYDFVSGDEGVRALTAVRLLEGARLYADIVTDKPPGTTVFYATIFALFGRSMAAVHLAAGVWNFATAAVVYLTAVLIYNRRTGLWAALFVTYFSTNYMTQDMMAANTELLMALPYTAAFYFFVRASINGQSRRRTIWLNLALAGAMTGIATLFKQVGVFNLAFFAMYEVFEAYTTWKSIVSGRGDWLKQKSRSSLFRLSVIAAGFVLTLALFVLWLISQGTLSDFWRNAVELNMFYIGSVPRSLWFKYLVGRTLSYIFFNASLFCLAILAGFYAAKRFNKDERDLSAQSAQISADLMVALWAVASFAAVFPGGRFFGHYFIQLLPALCLLGARGVKLLFEQISTVEHKRRARIIVAALLLLFIVGLVRFHQRTAILAYETLTGTNTGRTDGWGMTEREREAEIIARDVRSRLSEGEALYIWDYALDIYWRTGCRPASRYLTPYYITGQFTDAADKAVDPNVQFFQEARQHLIEDLNRERPRLILDVHGTMLKLPYPEITEFMRKNYRRQGNMGVSASRAFVVYELRKNKD